MPSTPAPVGASRPGRPGYDQESVLALSVQVFNRHGYDATSMGMLAGELGVSKSAIYHHVQSKEHLLRLALDEALVPLEALTEDDSIRTGPVAERLEHMLRATVRVLIDRQPYVTLLLRLRGNTDVERDALRRRRDIDVMAAELVGRAQQEGVLREDVDARTSTRLLFGMISSMAEWFRADGPVPAAQVEDLVVAMALDGLRARP
ncbi:TetR family transcriptional regulator [Brachybacterium vulturis]|uniref:TetR family transcriptional regulator n=1 Tax=Brachybacterium vulturis TaxID=2017484 RepID=A0A291GJW9_9MICO|nr:TetR/AcrR family transcriptional regulator [Brachybacterium vulturis]ATG50511.1 TetR family transcriptional regulator [Brachybacterium vulturis]